MGLMPSMGGGQQGGQQGGFGQAVDAVSGAANSVMKEFTPDNAGAFSVRGDSVAKNHADQAMKQVQQSGANAVKSGVDSMTNKLTGGGEGAAVGGNGIGEAAKGAASKAASNKIKELFTGA